MEKDTYKSNINLLVKFTIIAFFIIQIIVTFYFTDAFKATHDRYFKSCRICLKQNI